MYIYTAGKCAAHDYETSYLLSWKYPYATSDRLISFTLEEDTDSIFVKCEKCSIEWCGLDVTLPDEDAVERGIPIRNMTRL